MVIAQLTGSNLRIKSGNSGSPVVQRGKIIGFLDGTYAMPYRGSRLVVLLAVDWLVGIASPLFATITVVNIPAHICLFLISTGAQCARST